MKNPSNFSSLRRAVAAGLVTVTAALAFTPMALAEESALKDKTALFCGDSICAAAVYDDDDKTRWGWAGRIGRDYGVVYTNRGADGASISNCRETNRIVSQVTGQAGKTFDFVILHGGTNDGWDEAPVGQMSDSMELKDFDVSTYAGGLEELFYQTKRLFPNAKIGYIINFQTPAAIGTLKDMSAYYTVAKEICDKWEVPYLDLYFDEDFNTKVMQMQYNRTTVDKIHPNGKGYDVLAPYVARFMESLLVEEPEPTPEKEDNTDEGAGEDTAPPAEDETNTPKEEEKKPFGKTFLLAVGGVVAALFIAVGGVVIYKKKKKA